MWPVGTYERFLKKIKGQENSKKVDYFGVLFCDIRQTKAREYILNYLEVFNNRSGKYIDFYLPGYILLENQSKREGYTILIAEKSYVFDQIEYCKFCEKFEYDFNVTFPFSATLVLMEYKGGNFSTARKMTFELEDSDIGIKAAGEFFLQIFKCAENGKMGQTLDQISKALSEAAKKDMLFAGGKSIFNFFGVDIAPILDQYYKIVKFRIK